MLSPVNSSAMDEMAINEMVKNNRLYHFILKRKVTAKIQAIKMSIFINLLWMNKREDMKVTEVVDMIQIELDLHFSEKAEKR